MEEYDVVRVETGVQGLDDMLGGGIPEKSIILLCGGPGVGKTIMTLQYMMAEVNRGEPLVYVTLEEPLEKRSRTRQRLGGISPKPRRRILLRSLIST